VNIFAVYADRVRAALTDLERSGDLPPLGDLGRVVVEPPRDPTHGDLATNAALVLAKQAGIKPRDMAEKLVARLLQDPDIERAEPAGPGFVNLTLRPSVWHDVLASLAVSGRDFGRSGLGGGVKANVEYVSANPTGPMHVGHCRGAVFGDALANLLDAAGYAVTREYYINDAGVQVDVLARSVFLRYREALGETIGAIPEGLYPGDYLVPVGRELAAQHGPALLSLPEAEWLPIVRRAAIDAMMAMIREDLTALNIRHEVFFSEASLHGQGKSIDVTLDTLTAAGHIYRGTLPPPKGQLPEDWEDREQTLFRTTGFGDDIDRPLVKSDGSYTYFAADVAYMRDKWERGFRDLVFVLGADHGGYIKRLEAVARAISGGAAHVDVKLVQLVRLFRAGEPVKMSKRSGEFVTLREVVDEVGPDAVRFMMLFRKNDAVLDFDFAKVVEKSRDNPVFYVQYAHARGRSVLRNAGEAGIAPSQVSLGDLARLSDAGETALIKRLAEYPRILEAAALAREPHRIAFYLYDLASEFHAHWNRGKESPHLRFIIEDEPESTRARLVLVEALVLVIASGLAILGVTAPEEMR
jgi:arginyl-tRNA synthetase